MMYGNCNVKLIKGEAYNFQINFDNNESVVSSVFISCEKHNFCHELEQDSNTQSKWTYVFDKQETSLFEPCITTYTITMHSNYEQLEPQKLVNQTFVVVDDKNPQTC